MVSSLIWIRLVHLLHNTNLIQRQQSIFSIIYTSMSLLNFLLNQWQNNWWLIITNSANILFLRELQTRLIGGAKDSFFGLNHLIKTFHQNSIQLCNNFWTSMLSCSIQLHYWRKLTFLIWPWVLSTFSYNSWQALSFLKRASHRVNSSLHL